MSTKSKCRQIILLVLFSLFFQPSFSQIDQTARYEIKMPLFGKQVEIIPNGARGLFVLQDLPELGIGNNYWKMTHLDTALQEDWNQIVLINGDYRLTRSDTLDGTAYLLLSNLRNQRMTEILKIDKDGNLLSTPFVNLVPMSVTEFMVIDGGEKLLIGGYFNYRPVVVIYDYRTNRPRVLPGLINEPGTLLQLTRNEESRTIDVLINIPGKNLRGVWFKSFTYDAELKRNIRFESTNRKTLLDGQVIKLDEQIHMIVGPYGLRNSRYSRGLLVGLIDEEGMFSSREINYADLPNFFEFASEGRQKRIERRIERRRSKGKEPRFNFKVRIQELRETGEGFVLMGESHYEKYNPNYYQFMDYNQPQFRRMIFDGYVYTHAFLVGLDISGGVKWDQSIGTRNVKKFDLDRLVHFSLKREKGILMYPSRNKIKFSSFSTEDQKERKENEVSIELLHPNDMLGTGGSPQSELRLWYDNCYYVHGNQSIRNLKDKNVPLNRRVYFVNKFQYSNTGSPN